MLEHCSNDSIAIIPGWMYPGGIILFRSANERVQKCSSDELYSAVR